MSGRMFILEARRLGDGRWSERRFRDRRRVGSPWRNRPRERHCCGTSYCRHRPDRSRGGSAVPLPFDVTELSSVVDAVGRVGQVDILVNNAGNGGAHAMTVQPFVEMEPTMWDAPIQVNLYGVLHCCHAVVPGMVQRGQGSRDHRISSGRPDRRGELSDVTPHSAAKGGGIAFTRSLALEVARAGVTANTLALGLMEMPDPQLTERLARSIPVEGPQERHLMWRRPAFGSRQRKRRG